MVNEALGEETFPGKLIARSSMKLFIAAANKVRIAVRIAKLCVEKPSLEEALFWKFSIYIVECCICNPNGKIPKLVTPAFGRLNK